MHNTLTRKFRDLIVEYQELQTRYKAKHRERVERQYRIVVPHATDAEIEAALASDDPLPEVFTQQLQAGPGHAAARQAAADVHERHRDILRLEASIQELHQLFVDMSTLVAAQGELLDQVEYQVGQSTNYTGKAVEELKEANRYQKQVRKKICCLIIIILIVVAAVVTPLVIQFAGSGGGGGGGVNPFVPTVPSPSPSPPPPLAPPLAPPPLAP